MRALLVVAALTVAGCAGPSGAPAAGTPAPGQASEPQPQYGGVFQMMGLRDLTQMNPWTNISASTNFFLSTAVYETLVKYDYRPFEDWRQEYKLTPSLAESWEVKDGTTYTLHLRRNVKWHDGEPLTAKDVVWSFQYLTDPANKLTGGSILSTMASIEAADDYTARITTRGPDVEFLNKTIEGLVSILPKHVFDRGGSFEKEEAGSGPYRIESSVSGKGTTYLKVADYWKPGLPYVDRWRLLPTADDAGRLAAFLARQNDVLKVGNRAQAEAVLAQAPEVHSSNFLRDNASEMFLKLDRPPFNDQRVRQAVHLAVDRREMVNTLTQGDGIFNPPGMNAISKALAIPAAELESLPGWRAPKTEDLARARQLLAESGHANGLSFTIKVDRAHPDTPSQAEMISAQLKAIGVDAKLQPTETAAYTKNLVDGEYDAFIDPSSATQPESRGTWRQRLHTGGSLNHMPIADPELDRLIEAQAAEFDPAKRKELMLQVQRLLLQQAYVIPLITHSANFLWQPWVYGWVDNQAAQPSNQDWSQLWLDVGQVPKGR